MQRDVIETEVLIIGAGIAGFRAAMEAQKYGAEVSLVTKGVFGKDCGATWMAVNGYNCWGIYPDDTLDLHVEDTLRCGWFLNNQENVYAFLAHLPDTALELLKWGVRFQMKDGHLDTMWGLGCSTKEGRMIYTVTFPRGYLGYHYSRIFPRVIKARKINVIEDMFITDIATQGRTVVGAVGIDIRTGRFKVFKAKAVIIATGGYQGIYKTTTANHNLTGDGHGLALRASVDMADFEFNQTQVRGLWPPPLTGEVLPFTMIVNWDARMYNSENERFMEKWDTVKIERSTRAIISRAIFHQIKEGKASPHGGVYIGVTHKSKDFINKKLKEIERTNRLTKLQQAGIDLTKDYIEIGYAMHYCQGGCNVNSKCETDLEGLYAIGEAASGGKDGADRMMSNALPYCMAMGIIAGREAARRAKKIEMPEIKVSQLDKLVARVLVPLEHQNGISVYQLKHELQELMTKETLYGRTEAGLRYALKEVERYKEELLPKIYVANKSKKFNLEWINTLEFENLLLVSECIIRNAMLRKESRGLHERWDCMAVNPEWFKNIHLRLVDGEMKQWTTPVKFPYWKPEPGSLGEPARRGVRVKNYLGWKAEPLYKRM